MNYVREYYNKIQSGKRIVSNKIRKQFQILNSLLDDIESGKSSEWDFDEELGERPIQFIEKFCRHSKGKWAGTPVILEEWQKAITQSIFGFVNKKTKKRKYIEVLIDVARKNGKTTWIAGIALYLFLADGEGGAQVYCTANKLDQAKLLYKEACNMVSQSPMLAKIVKKCRTTLETKDKYELFATFSPLASDSTTLDGLNPSACIYDEIHASKTDELYSVIKQGFSSREEPLMIEITTSGFVRGGLYDNQYDYASDILNGVIEDESFLAFIYEQDDTSEIGDENTWFKSNPNLNVSKSFSYIRNVLNSAKSKKSEMGTVLTKDFNLPQNSRDGWLSLDFLKYKKTYTMDDLIGNYCIGGVDLSNVLDLTCATLILKKKGSSDDSDLYVIQKYFMPYDTLQDKMNTDKVPYKTWVDNEWIEVCNGNKVELSYVTNWFKKMLKELKLIPYWIGYDRWSASYWVDDMTKNGFMKLESVIQGPKTFDSAMKELKSMIEADKINYNNNPVLRWCLSNVVVKKDEGGNIGPDKKNSTGRIDGAVSLLDAIVLYLNHKNDYYNLQKIK